MNGKKGFDIQWVEADQHWAIVNQRGIIVQRYPSSCREEADAVAQSLNWIGYRYADEGLDFINGRDFED